MTGAFRVAAQTWNAELVGRDAIPELLCAVQNIDGMTQQRQRALVPDG